MTVDLSPESIAAALSAPPEPPSIKTLEVSIPHGGLDGYTRAPLAQFIQAMRTAMLSGAHRASWPRPEAVTVADVSITTYGTDRCAATTLSHLHAFIGKHLSSGALTIGDPVKVKKGPPRIVVVIRAIEIAALESAADKSARLAREMAPPQIRQDGSYEGELREYETPAFVTDQGIAEAHPLAERLDRIERSAYIPDPENEVDPPRVEGSEDPEAAAQRVQNELMQPDFQIDAKGGGGSGGRTRTFSNAYCRCGHRTKRHIRGEGSACEDCACEYFILPEEKSKARVPMNVPVSPMAKELLRTNPGLATEVLEKHALDILASHRPQS